MNGQGQPGMGMPNGMKMNGGQMMGSGSMKGNGNDAAFWEQKKLEMQQKSTEMRKKKIEELKAKGVDVSSISADLLDATKTDEAAFWEAMKKIMQGEQAKMRQKLAEELAKGGYDTSTLTADMLDPSKTDEPTFWNAVKAIKESKMGNQQKKPMNGQKQEMGMPKDNQGGQMGPGMGMGNKPQNGQMNGMMGGQDGQGMRVPNNGASMNNKCYGGPEGTKCGGSDQGNGQQGGMTMQKPANMKPALTEKEREKLVKKFKAVAEDKKAAYYEKTKANLEAQYEKVKNAKNKRLAMKIKETLALLEETLGNDGSEEDDEAILDEATN
jgi:hypothetical protein